MPIIITGPATGPGSIVDYDSLQQAISDWSHRSDLTSYIPTFIQLCEAELHDSLILKDLEFDEALTLTAGRNYVALPSAFISPIAFWVVVDSLRVPVPFVRPEELPYYTENTQPRMVAVDSENLRFDSSVDQNYTAYLRCIKSDNLSSTNTTNGILVHRPDIYLFGSLKQLALFSQDDGLLAKFVGPNSLYETALRQLKAANSRSKSIVTLKTELSSRARSNILIDE